MVPIPHEEFLALLPDSSRDGDTPRYFERGAKAAGLVGDARFLVISEKGTAKRVLSFHYLDYPEGRERYAASMTLDLLNQDRAVLSHRKMEVESGNRTGTSLYLETEGFARQYSALNNRPLTISAELDQYDVLKWLTKLGYEPTPESRPLYEDILANVGVSDKYYIDYDTTSGYRPLSIFERTPEGTPKAMPVRLTMQKVVDASLPR